MIVEQRDYHVLHRASCRSSSGSTRTRGSPIQQEVLGGFVGAFTDRRRRALDVHVAVELREPRASARSDGRRSRRATTGRRSSRKHPAADPHAAEPHPRADAVLADRVEVDAWASSTARSRSSRAAPRGSASAIADGLAARGRAHRRRRPPRCRGGGGAPTADGVGLTVDVADEDAVEGMVEETVEQLRRASTSSSTTPASTRRSRCGLHRDPARGVAARDGRQRRVDVPHLPRGGARACASAAAGDRQHLLRARRSAASRSCSTT